MPLQITTHSMGTITHCPPEMFKCAARQLGALLLDMAPALAASAACESGGGVGALRMCRNPPRGPSWHGRTLPLLARATHPLPLPAGRGA